jgi:ribosomal RNA-processing protein 8
VQRQLNIDIPVTHRIKELMNKNKKQTKRRKNKNKSKKQKVNNSKKKSPKSEMSTIKTVTTQQQKEQSTNDLSSAQFRWFNELLYTNSSQHSFKYVQECESEFKQYHATYNQIMTNEWPTAPIDIIIKSVQKIIFKCVKQLIQKNNSNSKSKSNTNKHELKLNAQNSKFRMADFGCGDAKFAQFFLNNPNPNLFRCLFPCLEIHSFDLCALNSFVTSCDMSHTPLEEESIDICIFCLSLMGSNLHQFLIEAHRVMKFDALLKIAEVRSRMYGINKFERCRMRK